MSLLRRLSTFLIPLLFFALGLLTLYDYGINWDSPIHFARGQAYLRYILTGKTNYEGRPTYCMNQENLNSRVDAKTGEVCNRHRKVRVSEYESNLIDFNSWVAKAAYGHPAFSNIMLAASNNIFFKTLGWVEDIDAYHLYSLFTTFLLALTVAVWTKQTFGKFAGIIAVLTIYTFPLLFAESHFNIKDPPMAAFFTLSLYLFWLAIMKKKPFYLILSALAGGASFATKFNFVFAPFILLPWLVAYGIARWHTKDIRALLSRKMLIVVPFYPIIVFLVFFLSWPVLWQDPLNNIFQVVKYYKDIGGPTCQYSYFTFSWLVNCSQLTTLKYLIYTVPPFSLFLFTVGFLTSIVRFRERGYVTVLWLSLFVITIMRVTLSITNIYGGLRQIMEFVPAFAMIAAIGALFLRDLIVKTLVKFSPVKVFKKETVNLGVSFLLIFGFIPIGVEMVKLHPNENVYFNSFIGGLRGAFARNFPGFGNTYGNAYLQGVKWINANAQPNSKLALVFGNAQNIPRGIIREDIPFSNGYRSGYNLAGEYQMGLVTGQDQSQETFRYKYLNTYLNPVYDLKIDGVSLLKIWKNSKEHLKNGVNLNEVREQIKTIVDRKEIVIGLDGKKNLKALGLTFPRAECKEGMVGAKIYVSLDSEEYLQKVDEINGFAEEEMRGFKGDFVYLFPGDEAKYIKITPPESYPCELSDIDFSLFTFVQLHNPNQ